MLVCVRNNSYEKMIKNYSYNSYKNGIVVFADDGCHVFINKLHIGRFNTWIEAHEFIDSLIKLCSCECKTA